MTTQAINATILASSHLDIAKRTSIPGLIFSCVMLSTGVIASASIFEMEDRSSTVSMELMVFGTTLFPVGVSRLLWKSKEIVYLPTDSVAKEQSTFFNLKYLGESTDMVKSGDFPSQSTAKRGTSRNPRLGVVLSKDKKFAVAQLLQFVSCTYDPIASVRYSVNGEAVSIMAFLAKIKGY